MKLWGIYLKSFIYTGCLTDLNTPGFKYLLIKKGELIAYEKNY